MTNNQWQEVLPMVVQTNYQLKVTKTKNCNEKNNFSNTKRVLLLHIKVQW
jgi:uncharacterized protein YeeX (DUF496 family)